LKIAAVKNRFGPHRADGKDFATLYANYSTCQISDGDSYGAMIVRDARSGYDGDYVPHDEYGSECGSMKYISWGAYYKGVAFGFSINNWSWHVDFLFWWIGGEW